MAVTADGYRVRLADPAVESAALAQLFAGGFADVPVEAARRKIDAQYVRNPAGRAPCTVLVAGDTEDAGMQALVPRRFFRGSEPCVAATMADYLVLPAHRSLGPALQLLQAAVRDGTQRFAFLYGFPNAKAVPVFKRAGFTPAGELVRYAAPLRAEALVDERWAQGPSLLRRATQVAGNLALGTAASLRGSRAARALRWRDLTDDRSPLDALWGSSDRTGLLVGDRSAAMLGWRFDAGRAWTPSCAFDAAGALVGYVAWSASDGLVHLRDCWARVPQRDLGAVLSGFLRYIRRQRWAQRASFEFLGPPALVAAVESAGLWPRDRVPVYAIAGAAGMSPAIEGWYLTSFDRDAD